VVEWDGRSFDAARSKAAPGENAVATFAYSIMLNMNGLRESEHETWPSLREHPGAINRQRKSRVKWDRKRAP